MTLIKNYWTLFYCDNKITDVEKITSKTEISKGLGDKLFALLDKAIINAKEPKSGGFTLDGVVYVLSKLSNGSQKSVFKHSPDKSSKSGQIIGIMQQIIDNIKYLDEITLSNIENKIIAVYD